MAWTGRVSCVIFLTDDGKTHYLNDGRRTGRTLVHRRFCKRSDFASCFASEIQIELLVGGA